MNTMRTHIENDTFPSFVIKFMEELYPNKDYPSWIINALQAVNIKLNTE